MYALAGLLAAGAAGCANAPGTTYRLTADQLAWQPYGLGQVLRFGNSRTAAVRTYRIQHVADATLETPRGNGLVAVPGYRGKDPDQFQSIDVDAARIDSAAAGFKALTLRADPNSYSGAALPDAPAYAQAAWSADASSQLPIAEVSRGIPFDTAVYQGVRLLSGVLLGSATYAQVLVVRQPVATASVPVLYYARGAGIVGFVERKTGLWYRLP